MLSWCSDGCRKIALRKKRIANGRGVNPGVDYPLE
jgi:hypothetical protein